MFHVHGNYLTIFNVFSNNRGENDSNVSTLQKLTVGNKVFTTNSGETIKYALRKILVEMCSKDEKFNRSIREDGPTSYHEFVDKKHNPTLYFDDDVFGYFEAGEGIVRRAALEIARAISIAPYPPDASFNCKSRSNDKKDPTPYGSEFHGTRYQFGFSMTPSYLKVPSRVIQVLTSLRHLAGVGGNQANWRTDYSPDSIIFRLTESPAPGIFGTFEGAANGPVSVPKLIRSIRVGDLDPAEIYLGGLVADTDDAKKCADMGVHVIEGVSNTVATVCDVIREKLGLPTEEAKPDVVDVKSNGKATKRGGKTAGV